MVAKRARISFSLLSSRAAVMALNLPVYFVVQCLQSESPGRPPQAGVLLCPIP